jgi:asparagine synthase (glutamine-hydrolysing)
MFALAIWDAPRRRLVIARDRLGKKPLYYRRETNRLLFASELKSLLEVPGLERQLDPQALDEYLTFQYVPHPRTIFRGFSKLPPAHYGVFCDGRFTTHCYWNPDFDRQVERPIADYTDELRALLTSAVELRLESDVPLGAFLSGGVDSSLVVALMQRLVREPVKTFSIGFAQRDFDESAYARKVAARLGTDHHEFRVEPQAIEVLEKLAWHYDEPFADSSAIPTYYVAKLSREHVTVALTGDGGDELFAGYDRYRAVRLAGWFDRLPRALRAAFDNRLLRRWGGRGRQRSLLRRVGRFAEALSYPPQRRYLEWVSMFNEARRAELYRDDFVAQLPDCDPYQFLAEAFARLPHRDIVSAAGLVDLVTYLPCDLMTKVDIASMANSLECRAPFLDYRVVELAAQMPLACKLRGRQTKYILRRAFADLLPPEATKRPKMGFGVPVSQWFRGELKDYARQVLLDPAAAWRDYFRAEAVERLLAEHQQGAFDHGYRLWGLLFFEVWHRTWLAPSAPATARASATA